jgi:hypothetical protein
LHSFQFTAILDEEDLKATKGALPTDFSNWHPIEAALFGLSRCGKGKIGSLMLSGKEEQIQIASERCRQAR